MLTNNKKNFVRSIAVVLAMLMVLAVCLTGCGNKAAEEALTKAEAAQTTADAAQNAANGAQSSADAAQNAANGAQGTADEAKSLAEEVKAALANYLLTADLEGKVDALIDAALADGTATKAEVEALAKELDAYIADDLTEDEITAMIKAEVAANAVVGAQTKDDVLEILKGYYTKDEIDEKLGAFGDINGKFEDYYTKDEIDAQFKSFFGELKAEQVYALLKDVEKIMDQKEWDEASAEVIATIEAAQKLVDKTLDPVEAETYLQANMEAVNAALSKYNLTPFVADADGYFAANDLQTFQKHLEYMILRQATKADMEALLNAIDAALAVPTFESELKALQAELFGLGEYVAYGTYGTGDKANEFTSPVYTAAGTYHGKNYAKDDKKETQVVTLHDKAAFYAWNADFEALLTTYTTDKKSAALTTVNPADYNLTVSSVWVKTTTNNDGTTTTTVALEAATLDKKDGYTNKGLTVADLTYWEYIYGAKTLKTLENTDTILVPVFNANAADAIIYNKASLMRPEAQYSVITDWKKDSKDGKYGKYGYDGNEAVYSDTKLSPWTEMGELQDNMAGISNAYSAIAAQLIECLTAANDANEMFDKFQKDVIYAYGVLNNKKALKVAVTDYAKVTDDQLVEALAVSMCEPDKNPSLYPVYLTDIDNTTYNVTQEMKQSLALNNNGKDDVTIGINEYPLYERMMDKAYDLLWTKYKLLASEWADKILLDYISITYEANDNTAHDATSTNATGALTVVNGDHDTLVTYLNTKGERADDAYVSEGFIDAFLNGKDVPDEAGEVNIYKRLGHSYKNNGLELFYHNNGKAPYVVGKSTDQKNLVYGYFFANPLKTIRENDEDIRDLLADAMRNVDLAIAGAKIEDKKGTDLPVQEAFHEYLVAGIENLEEIYDRFLLNDYAYMLYNNMAVDALSIIDFYGDETLLNATVYDYLFGCSHNFETGDKAFSGTIKRDTNGKITDYTLKDAKVKYTSDKIITNGVKKEYQFGLNAGQFTANVNSKTTVNPYTQSADGTTPKIAGEAMKAMQKYYGDAYTDVENMVIKVNFLDYIGVARGNLDDLDIAYWVAVRQATPDAIELLDELTYIKGNFEASIVNIKYYADRDVFALNEYRSNYIDLLTLIAGKDHSGAINPHLALLSGKTTNEVIANATTLADEQFTERLKNVKSSQIPTAATDSTAIIPTAYVTNGYEFVGMAAEQYDETVNGQATYKIVENGKDVTKNLY